MGTTTQSLAWARDSGAGEVNLTTPGDKVIVGDAAVSTSDEAAIETRRTDAFNILPRIFGIQLDNPPVAPVEGAVAYDTKPGDKGIYYYDGSAWIKIVADDNSLSHANLTGLTADDHLQYVKITGRGCCQTIYGGDEAGGDLTLISNNTATKGNINIGTSVYDDTLHRLGLNMQGSSPAHTLDVNGDARIQGLGTGLVRADAGLFSIDSGGVTGQWDRATSPIAGVYPIQSNDAMFVGTGASSSLASKCYIQGNSGDGAAQPIMAVRAGNSHGADIPVFELLNFASSTRQGAWFENGHLHLGPGTHDANLSIENNTGIASNPYPVLTTAQRDALSSLPNGAAIWNSDTNKLNIWVGSQWHEVNMTAVGGGGPTLTAWDNFNRAAANLHGSTASDGTNTWTKTSQPDLSGDADWDLLGTTVGNSNPVKRAGITLSGQQVDGICEVQLTTVASGGEVSFGGIMFRHEGSEDGHMWMVQAKEDTNQIRVGRWNSTAPDNGSEVGQNNASWTWADGDWIKVEFSGVPGSVSVDVYVKTAAGSYPGTPQIALTNQSQEWTSTANHGLLTHSSNGGNDVRWGEYNFYVP